MKYKIICHSILLITSICITKTYAKCTPVDGFITTDLDMTLGRIVILPSDQVGKVLKQAAIPYYRNDKSVYYCNTSTQIIGRLVQNPSLSSLGNNIYNTNLPGIGIRLSRTNLFTGGTTYYPYTIDNNQGVNGGINLILADGIFNIEIIKTAQNTGSGPISPGMYTKHYVGSLNANTPSLTTSLKANAITIASSSCEIQGNINKFITLPTVTRDKFKGIGTTAGEQNFNLNILCNGGQNPTNVQVSNKISLQFDYTANSDLKSIVNSAPTNTAAKGVSIQLINKYQNANTVINKGSTYTLGTVNSNQTVIYNVPLSARYIQTAQTVTTGKVRGLATITIEYE